MQTTQLDATAVVRKNSIGFIEQVFKLYEARRPLVLVADEEPNLSTANKRPFSCKVSHLEGPSPGSR